ncbi:MAG TPA: L-seryl-tRNA(Sec) selenium transferase [Thermoleophilaceae bacterium]|nr:L-seryl-tRNA(Sec) selenium transferase [Thermoleophilaceae bacterium]
MNARLRELPSVEELSSALGDHPHPRAVRAARETLDLARAAILDGREPRADLVTQALSRAEELARPELRRVLNATGVIVHTNLGRAPLAEPAARAAERAGSGYSNLEYDLAAGERGSRQAHVERLVCELTGAEAALVVNNCAAAVLLAAAALAAGRELVVSRGQLVEIGGSFRVPDVVAQSGARLREVGTTNRTRLEDYRAAIGPETGALLRVHPSNFRTVGFTEEAEIEELCSLGVPVIDDVGSGALAEGVPELAGEPPVRRSVQAGSALVCFSGDKLLGGPQAGVMAGTREAVDACRSHPLARAMRIDKLSLAALEATLALYRDGRRDELPVLRMLTAGAEELQRRAELMREQLCAAGADARVVESAAKVGGGALPLLELRGPVCAVDPGGLALDELARRLRAGDPPVVARAREGWLLLDPRTLDDVEAELAARAVVAALR